MGKEDTYIKRNRKMAIMTKETRKERESHGYWEKEGDIVDY